jgi:hypothetical protein
MLLLAFVAFFALVVAWLMAPTGDAPETAKLAAPALVTGEAAA